MNRLSWDDMRAALPALDELEPLLAQLLAGSEPDPAHDWSGSGIVETAGARLVDPERLAEAVGELAEREAEHVRTVYRRVTDTVTAYAAGEEGAAARVLLDLFAAEEGRDRPERAEAYADSAMRAAEASGDASLRSLALRRRARARRALARYAEGERDYARSFEIADAVGDLRGAAEAAIGAGNLLEDEARWDEAEVWYRRAQARLEQRGEPTTESWHVRLNLHIVQRSRGHVDESLEALREAEAIAADLGDDSAGMFLENAWGQWHLARGEHEEAEACFRTALHLSRGSRARVTIRLNLADALLASGRLLEAADEARRAEREAVTGRAIGRLPEVYRLLGRVAAADGNPNAFVLFERALDLVRSAGLPEVERARTLDAYARTERASGEDEHAEALAKEASVIFTRLGIIQEPATGTAEESTPPEAR